jgi:hypothetical protein
MGCVPSRNGVFIRQRPLTHFDECTQNYVHALLPFAPTQFTVAVALAITLLVETDATFEV